LKLIEPHLGNEIDIDNYDYVLNCEDWLVDRTKKDLLYVSRFSNLADQLEDNLLGIIKPLWDNILSQHPSTSKIFTKGKRFDIKYSHTFKILLTRLNSVDLSTAELDILGSAYEEVIKDIMTGKVLGQFFTQPSVKRLMVDIINPQIYADGKIETCGDPTMGTGGFLITYLGHILKQAREKGITPNWEFIKTEGLYGKELEPDTFQLAVSNMLISSGHLFDQLDCGDSIRVPITRKFDNILANPPFGIKGLKYDSFTSSLKNQYIPIKSDNAVTLFIQVIIYMLKMNGKCAVVLPDGQDLSNTKNYTLVAVREYLMKTCDLQEIIYLQAGIFENTNIKTCVFYFIKKKKGSEALNTNITLSRANKETKREYNFTEEHQTRTVKFYSSDVFNQGKDNERIEKKLIIEVPIERIKANKYSLKYADYVVSNVNEVQYGSGVVMKKIGEIFTFNVGTLQAMKCDETNIYPVISSSDIHTHSTYSLDGENIFILKIFDGSANKTYSSKIKYFKGKCSYTSLLYHMSPINVQLFTVKYMYYFLNNKIDYISKEFQKGSCNKSLDLELFLRYEIPIPPLAKQQEVVEYFDFIYEKTIKSSEEKIADLKKENQYLLDNQRKNGQNTMKTLVEICDLSIKGNTNTNEISNTGEYPFYKASVTNPSGTHNNYCFSGDEYILFVKSGGNSKNPLSLSHGIGKVFFVSGESSGNTEVVKITCNLEVKIKYLFYYLQKEQLNIQKLAKYSTNLGHIDMNKFKELEIPIPTLARQQEILEYLDENDKFIKQLEKQIERNKEIAKSYFESILGNN